MNFSYDFGSDTKNFSKDYIILELRLSLNKNLYDEKLISYEIFNKMQDLLLNRMNKLIGSNSNN